MNITQKFKILWCDRNIYQANLKDLLSSLSNLDIATFESTSEAIEVFKNDKTFHLIISGNLFSDDHSGITFFKSLGLDSSYNQFLLFTAEKLRQDHPYLILKNFTYYHKNYYTPEAFENTVLGLLDRAMNTEDTHIRVFIIRAHFGLSVGEFAARLRIPNEIVSKYETDASVPSSYVLSVCNQFRIPLEFFSIVNLNLFIERLQTIGSTKKKDVI